MKGFSYGTNGAVNHSIPQWRSLAHEAIRIGGFVREDRRLGETFIHGPRGMIAEVYGVGLKLEKRHD